MGVFYHESTAQTDFISWTEMALFTLSSKEQERMLRAGRTNRKAALNGRYRRKRFIYHLNSCKVCPSTKACSTSNPTLIVKIITENIHGGKQKFAFQCKRVSYRKTQEMSFLIHNDRKWFSLFYITKQVFMNFTGSANSNSLTATKACFSSMK